MVEKRKRYMAVRETTSAKRRSPSPPTTAGATPELAHDVPTTFARDGPLPVLPVRQEKELPLKEYKSVAESRVMQESLERSRRKWVDGDIFEKFWTKPLKSRRLDPVEMEKNPGKDCMTRLGSATLSCKPHKFEIKLFGVLEPVKVPPAPPVPTPALPQPQPQPQTLQRQPQPQQMQPVNGVQQGAPSAGAAQPVQQQVQTPLVPHQQPATQGHVAAAPQRYVPAQAPAQRPMHLTPQQQQYPQHQQHPQHQQQQHQQHPQHLQHPQHQQHPQHPQYHPQQPPHPQQPGPPRPDPVIQSLAIRAAEDPELKALMRIVASGKATQEQLKIFQGHIDALTPQPLVPTAARPIAPAQGLVRPQPPQQMHPHPQHLQHLQHPHHHQHQQHMQHPHNQQQQHPHPSYMVQHPRPQYQQAHQAPRPQQVAPPKPKPFPQPPKQEITAIVFEFTDPYSQGDRFLFPKYSILEYSKNGMMVIASFMVTRKPIDDLDEYYQPLTITLESTSPRNLEILQRVVKDADTTREHMKKLMATLKRADDSFLAFRLRREPGDAVPDRLDAPLLLPPPPPPGRRESRVRRDASTPVVPGETKEAPRGPRVKNVKKALPREPTTTAATTNTTTTTTNTPTTTHTTTTPTTNLTTTPPTTTTTHPHPPSPHPKPPKPPRSRKGRIADPTKSCTICKTSKTSLWRKADIDGENVTVCNACGIKWKTNAQRAAQQVVGDTIVVKGVEEMGGGGVGTGTGVGVAVAVGGGMGAAVGLQMGGLVSAAVGNGNGGNGGVPGIDAAAAQVGVPVGAPAVVSVAAPVVAPVFVPTGAPVAAAPQAPAPVQAQAQAQPETQPQTQAQTQLQTQPDAPAA